MRVSTLYARNWTLVFAVGLSLIVTISIWLSEGRLIYTLDDPYIHLALAENIARGGYGVNILEFSSPSSSILYPLILAVTEVLRLGYVGPLIINAAATGLSIWLLLEFFWRNTIPLDTPINAFFPNAIAPFLILSINAIALPMTGMEHSLHVLAVIASIRGLVTIAEAKSAPVWFVPAVISMPLLRFEGMALAAAVVLALIILKRWRMASAIGVGAMTCVLAYGLVMSELGLPLLPSSVLVKSGIAENVLSGSDTKTSFLILAQNLKLSISTYWGAVFALTIFGLVSYALIAAVRNWQVFKNSITSPRFIVGGTMVLALIAHLIAGNYGWFYRYEVYAVAILIVCCSYLLRRFLHRLIEARSFAAKLGILIVLATLIPQYLKATLLTPMASRGIYEQQFQMHRFATEFFPYSVAVNDLGLVSYKNDSYVLDLWGLGSENVRLLRMNGNYNSVTISALVEGANVDYAMIYENLFRHYIPENWCLVATLKTEKISAMFGTVNFYATNHNVVQKLRTALDRFAPTLPKRVILIRQSCEVRRDKT
jgi:hypothetical protein